MQGLIKPKCPSLSARQDKSFLEGIDYRFDAADTLEEARDEAKRMHHFVDELESFSFISPNERRYYSGYITNKLEEKEETCGE